MYPPDRSARGYRTRFASPEQDGVLDDMLATCEAAGEGAVAVFDLDGCLFDNRPRIIQIWRELGSRADLPALHRIEPEHFDDWTHSRTFHNAGLTPAEIDEALPKAEPAFFRAFFDGEYCVHDHPMPGARRLVWAAYRAGLSVVYLTGRHEEMRAGSTQSILRCGFPLERPRTELVMKPDMETDDLAFKGEALREIRTMGEPVLLVDNEPGNVNVFHEHCPDALIVWVETDHSPRPIHPHPSIPGIRSWTRTTDSGAQVGRGMGPPGSGR